MTITVKNKQYQDILKYLKKEELDFFYREFREGYFFKKSAFPEMNERQYLIFVSQKTKKRTRTKLVRIDESLVSEEEIANLERIINSSPKLKKIAKRYFTIRNSKEFSSYLPKSERKKVERKIIDDLYENMDKEDKRKYSKDRLIIIMPKLNIGPYSKWKQNPGQGENASDINNKSMEDFIARNRDVFEGNEKIPEKMLETYYEEELKNERNIPDARGALNKLIS